MTSPQDTSPEADGAEFSPIRFHRLDLALAVVLLVLSLLPAAPLLIRHQTILGAIEPGNSENLNEWLPFRRIIADGAAHGYFPAWMPQFNSGTPLIGWPHASRFAPLGIIYSLLPFTTAAVVGTYVHLAIFILSLYFLMRLLSRQPAGSFLGCVFAMLLWQIGEADHFMPRLFTFSWVPMLFACYVGIWRTRKTAYALGAVAVLGLQILGGNMESIGREYLTLTIVAIGILIFAPREILCRKKQLLTIALTMALGIALGLVQFLPAFEFVHFCTRSDPSWFTYEVFSGTASLRHLPAYARVTMGAVTPAVLMISLIELRRRKSVTVILFTAVILALLAANAFSVLRIVRHLPFAGEMMWHQLNFYFVNILLAILAARAADHILQNPRPRHLVIAAVSCILFALFLRFERGHLAVSSYQFPMDLVGDYQDRIWPLYIALALAALALAVAGGRTVKAARIWLVTLFVIEGFAPSFFIMHRQTDPFPNFNPAYVKYFSEPHPFGRSMALAPASRFNKRSIPYQLGVLPGEQTVDSFMTSSVRWYGEFYMALLGPGPDGKLPRLNFQLIKTRPYISARNLHLLDLLNVVYLITEDTNLKLASHYFPAYYWDPRECDAASCRRTGLDGLTPAGVEMTAPGSWGQTWFVPEAASFQFAIKNTSANIDGAAFFQVRVEGDDREKGRLIFARHFLPRDWESDGVRTKVGLSEFGGRSVKARLDLLQDPGREVPANIEIVNPAVLNPNSVFQRLGLAGVNIFVNSGVLGRAFIVHDYKVISDPDRRLAAIGDPSFAPGRQAILESKIPEPVRPPRWAGAEKVELLSYDDDRVTLSANLAEPGIIMLSDVYYPGWRAEVDGIEQRIHRADHAFRAVWLDAGRHSLVFTFRPRSLRIGVWVSTTTAIFVVILCLVLGTASKRRPLMK